jgi:hypothetical protein
MGAAVGRTVARFATPIALFCVLASAWGEGFRPLWMRTGSVYVRLLWRASLSDPVRHLLERVLSDLPLAMDALPFTGPSFRLAAIRGVGL